MEAETRAARVTLGEPLFDHEVNEPGILFRRAALTAQLGMEHLGASLYEIEPGHNHWPYHFHYGSEELLIVIDGTPSLRTPEGWRQLQEGEVVSFKRGPSGAHQVANQSDETVRVLIIGEFGSPDICVYPDAGKIATLPESWGLHTLPENTAWFRLTEQVSYWDGESPPGES